MGALAGSWSAMVPSLIVRGGAEGRGVMYSIGVAMDDKDLVATGG